jgi:hypothetical protein
MAGVFGQGNACLLSLVVEQAQLDPLGHFGE